MHRDLPMASQMVVVQKPIYPRHQRAVGVVLPRLDRAAYLGLSGCSGWRTGEDGEEHATEHRERNKREEYERDDEDGT